MEDIKKELKQKARKIRYIIKTEIDKMDFMGLLAMHCPEDEYDMEIDSITAYYIHYKDIITVKQFAAELEKQMNVDGSYASDKKWKSRCRKAAAKIIKAAKKV